MANIAITKYCNLKCKYCFADDMIQEESENKYIDLKQYIKILTWIGKCNDNHIGIIGGEPTLHPQFDKILKITSAYCSKYKTTATLFTNGIELNKYINLLDNNIHILININSPEIIGENNWNKILSTLDNIPKNNLTIGCNLYPGETNYKFIFDLAQKYNLNKIRFSVTAPGGIYKNLIKDRDNYFNLMKPIFLNFIDMAIDYNITLQTDCSQIPDCYFSLNELQKIYNISIDRHHGICNPVVDITPDFKATTCFGSYDLIDCKDFDTLEDLKRYMSFRKSIKLIENNNCNKCKNCKELELLYCQGGCLGFNSIENKGE